MKLNIGQNIRSLRRTNNMTQEELAEKLGVTFQTVSRWETGGTYPDMELLPVIAGIFDVTADHLLGTDTKKKQESLQTIFLRMQDAVRRRENPLVIELLRELRRDIRRYSDCIGHFCMLWHCLRWYLGSASAEVLEEIRLFHQEYCLYAASMENLWWPAWTMTAIEDDEHLEDILKKYCANRKFSAEEFLLERWGLRQDEEKLSAAEELCRYSTLRKLFEDNAPLCANDRGMTEFSLSCLHLLCGVTPDPEHPVTGDGSLDLWVDLRLQMGWRLAELCIGRGDTDRAFTVLADMVRLYEALFEQAEQAKNENRKLELSTNASILPDFRITGWTGWAELCSLGSIEPPVKFFQVYLDYSIFGKSFHTQKCVDPLNDCSRLQVVFGDFMDDPRLIPLHNRLKVLSRTDKTI